MKGVWRGHSSTSSFPNSHYVTAQVFTAHSSFETRGRSRTSVVTAGQNFPPFVSHDYTHWTRHSRSLYVDLYMNREVWYFPGELELTLDFFFLLRFKDTFARLYRLYSNVYEIYQYLSFHVDGYYKWFWSPFFWYSVGMLCLC